MLEVWDSALIPPPNTGDLAALERGRSTSLPPQGTGGSTELGSHWALLLSCWVTLRRSPNLSGLVFFIKRINNESVLKGGAEDMRVLGILALGRCKEDSWLAPGGEEQLWGLGSAGGSQEDMGLAATIIKSRNLVAVPASPQGPQV